MNTKLFHYLPYLSATMGSWPKELIDNKNLRKIYMAYKLVVNVNIVLFTLTLLVETKDLILARQFEQMLEVLKTLLLSFFCISKLYSGTGIVSSRQSFIPLLTRMT